MKLFPPEASALIDEWWKSGTVFVSESPNNVTLSKLEAPQVDQLWSCLRNADYPLDIFDGAGSTVRTNEELLKAYEPYRVSLQKNVEREYTEIFTLFGFQQAVTNGGWLRLVYRGVEEPIRTHGREICPEAGQLSNHFVPECLDPREILRDFSGGRVLPANVLDWVAPELEVQRIARKASESANAAVEFWMRCSIRAILLSVADQVFSDGSVRLSGPPSVDIASVLDPDDPVPTADFESLQRLAKWLFVSNSSVESRRVLVASELSRFVFQTDGSLWMSVRPFLPRTLDAAQSAYHISTTKNGAEAIKVLSDLRKSVVEETSKISDTTRQLTTGISGATFLGLGIIAAKLTLLKESSVKWAVVVMAVVLFMYIVVLVVNGYSYIRLLNRAREDWKIRIVKYLPLEDYNDLVELPVSEAVKAYTVASIIALILSTFILIGMFAATVSG